MADFEKLFQHVMDSEGRDKVNVDAGGRTQWGISEKSNPSAWADGKVTEGESREIFLQKYVVFPKFHLIPPSHAALQSQLIDYGFNSGQDLVIRKLQSILGVKPDGVLGPKTLEAVAKSDPRLVNNKLVAARCLMLARLVQRDPKGHLNEIVGLLDRALSFTV